MNWKLVFFTVIGFRLAGFFQVLCCDNEPPLSFFFFLHVHREGVVTMGDQIQSFLVKDWQPDPVFVTFISWSEHLYVGICHVFVSIWLDSEKKIIPFPLHSCNFPTSIRKIFWFTKEVESMRGREFTNVLRAYAFLEDMLKKFLVSNLCLAFCCRTCNGPKTANLAVLRNKSQVHSFCAFRIWTGVFDLLNECEANQRDGTSHYLMAWGALWCGTPIARGTDDMAIWTVVKGGWGRHLEASFAPDLLF